MTGRIHCLYETMSRVVMMRVTEPDEPLRWLVETGTESQSVTGYDAEGWEHSTWVLHALYENPELVGLGSHDDVEKMLLAAGDVEPVIVGNVNLSEATTDSGIPLGYVLRPEPEWQRVRWSAYLKSTLGSIDPQPYPPSFSLVPERIAARIGYGSARRLARRREL